ncbi:hypothetical protein, partial [Vibrio mediterranei]|uniref:hypothetical protein n=1 Tax=Vibrio mediterranei TaxID=689 RepID=UPI001EFE3003
YQDATDITKDPSSVIDTTNGEYTDCEEVTTPGDTITTERGCTDTRISETRSCSIGRDIDLDTNYLYECNVERSQVANVCEVGRVIDVTQSHKYKCRRGQGHFESTCTDKLEVTVEHSIKRKYKPIAICDYQTNDILQTYLNSGLYFIDSPILESSTTYGAHILGDRFPFFYLVQKPANTCDLNVYTAPYHYTTKTYSYHSLLFSGTYNSRCENDDVLANDGYCYSKDAIEFTSPIASCPLGSLQNDKCIVEPAWVERFSMRDINTDYAATSVGGFFSGLTRYSANGKKYSNWMGDFGITEHRAVPLVNESNAEDIIYAKRGSYKTTTSVSLGRVDSYSIFIANTSSPTIRDPIYRCANNGQVVGKNDTCYSINPPLETVISERWLNTCN